MFIKSSSRNYAGIMSLVLVLCFVFTGCDLVSDNGEIIVSQSSESYSQVDTKPGISDTVITSDTEDGHTEIQVPYYPSATDWTDPLYQGHYNFNEVQLRTYNIMLEAFRRNISPISLPEGISEEELSDIYKLLQISMYNYSHLPIQYMITYNQDKSEVTSFSVDYSTDAQETENQRQYVEETAADVIDDFYEGMSDWAKIKYIHDYIALNCQYDVGAPHPDSSYGVLHDGRAMCEGYSKTFALLCNRAGIECLTVTGKADPGNGAERHMWNMVKYNGNWYHIDVTWDDPAGSGSSWDNIEYSYFMLSSSQIRADHTVINEGSFMEIPEATATEGNYYIRKSCYIWSYEDAEKIILDQLVKAFTNKTDIVYIKAATPTLFNDIKSNILSDSEKVAELVEIAKELSGEDFNTESYIWYSPNRSQMTYKFKITRRKAA